jgi:hypothetical protein
MAKLEIICSNFELLQPRDGDKPNQSDLLIPHRKDHYLLVFIRRAGRRQWIDMTPYMLKENTIYFTGPNQIIVKEEFNQLWSTGIAFTKEFLSFQENVSISTLPLIQDPQDGYELLLTEADIDFVDKGCPRSARPENQSAGRAGQ